MQSDSKISITFAEIVKTTGVKCLLIFLAVRDGIGRATGYTDLDFIPDSNEDDIYTIYLETENNKK